MTVTTDKADYAPGSTATFIVAGVNSGSSVAFQIADLASDPGINGIADVYAPFSVTDGGPGDSDGLANGVVVTQWQVPADGSATGATLQLTATSGSQTATTTFSDAPNKVVLENQKPGNPESEWGIDGAGSSNIEGFATDISTNRGQTVNFKINTNSSNYRIDIYRLGYYGGMGARKVATIQHTGVQNQPHPLRDRDHRPGRRRQLVGFGLLDHSGRRGLGRLHRQARAPGRDRRREPDPVHRARRQQP